MKDNLRLVYFSGCPNIEVAREALNRTFPGQFIETEQKTESSEGYSSPTILYGSQLIVGSKNSGAACTIRDISLNKLIEKLLKFKEEL